DRVAFLADGVVDVGRQQLEGRQLLAPPRHVAVHDEALVQAHQVADEGALQQVVADGDARGRQFGVEHRVVDEGRVHYDVAVVGQEQVRRARLQLFQPGEGDAVGGALHGAVDVRLD